jgi:hypothetical protein
MISSLSLSGIFFNAQAMAGGKSEIFEPLRID